MTKLHYYYSNYGKQEVTNAKMHDLPEEQMLLYLGRRGLN